MKDLQLPYAYFKYKKCPFRLNILNHAPVGDLAPLIDVKTESKKLSIL